MKNLFIYFVVLSLVMVSCRREELTPIDERVWDDPKEIEGLYFKGVVSDLDQTIANALIEVFQGEKKVGEVRSREDGRFDTRDIQLKEGLHVTFNILHDTYVPKTQRVTASEKITDLGKVILGKTTDSPLLVSSLENPGSNDLIVVSGYVTTPDNLPVSGVVVGLLYDIVEVSPVEISLEGAIVFTDESGYYEALLPQNQMFEYIVQQNGCNSKILNNFDFVILGGLPVERVGPFSENTQLPTKNNALTPSDAEVIGLKLVAQFLNCDNQPIQNGRVEYTIEIQGSKRSFSDRIFLGTWLHDTLYFCVDPNLSDQSIKIEMVVRDNATRNTSEDLEFVLDIGQNELGDIIVCKKPPVERSQLNIFMNNTVQNLYIGTDNDPKNSFIRNDTLFVPKVMNVEGGSVSFFIPNYLDYSNIYLHNLRFIIDGENYESATPVQVITVGTSPGDFINGFIATRTIQNMVTGQFLETPGLGSVIVQY